MGFLGRPPEGQTLVWPVGAWLGTGSHPCQAGPGPALYIHWFLNYYFFFLAFFFLLISKGGVRVRVGGLGREQQQGYLPSSPGPAGWRPLQVGAPGPHPARPAAPAAELTLEPPPEVPSLDLTLTHMRAHTSTQLHQDDGNNNFTLSFFFFLFCTRQLKKTPQKKKTQKNPNNQTKKLFAVSFPTSQHVPPQILFPEMREFSSIFGNTLSQP